MKNRRGLGRGLGALIPAAPLPGEEEGGAPVAAQRMPFATGATAVAADAAPDDEFPGLAPVPGAQFREVPVDSIAPNPKQPRKGEFDEEAMEELKTSITEVGILQPVVVREKGTGSYELIMGERRWRASKAIGRETIPAIIRDTSDDHLLRDALLENIHRSNLNPLEEAAAYQQLLAEFGVTQEELSKRIGRSRPQISNTIRLLNLPSAVQRRVAAGVLSAGHARALLSLDDSEAQDRLATRIVAEGLSVRATEEIVALGGDPEPAPERDNPTRRPKLRSPGLEELAGRLSDRFDTRVKVDLGKRKGRITIEFATIDDLERIADAMGVASPPEEQ
ncbi:ParB/RepB/Spo0J family partition protein [Cryptosporangium phraense]|uniref:ParB/RepB/Spo0J family partition protein n=1 Tax=Cryptosporangium phraense TaxID=2593070 RepID=A0A545AJG7_9ACTN|nr:ParB/RepB/Spo0J family partition protein [Cryptosporangium phraense]TQS41467.1 ParB/RepB/Spo0J family partition protein [Cryptosporangium phraense]